LAEKVLFFFFFWLVNFFFYHYIAPRKYKSGYQKLQKKKLNGLAILSLKKKMLKKIDYKSLINNFAFKRARKIKI
jgi:hypothetical protein